MRVANTMTITSRYDKDACFFLYKTSDDTYGASDGWGWLRKDQSKTVDVGGKDVKVGFKNGETWLASWYAKPVVVKPNRPVTLTAKGEIQQPTEDEFPNPGATTNVNFMEQFQTSVHDTARSIVIAALGKIPEVGGLVSAALGYIWPEKKPGVEDLIAASEDRMKAWVHGRIAEYDRDFLKNKLGGLRKNMTEYIHAKGKSERHTWMDTCLAQFNDAQGFFTKKNYTDGTLCLAFEVATMHLTLLRERVTFKQEIFGDEGNLDYFKRALKETIADYQNFVHYVGIPGEMRWREDLMERWHSGYDAIGQELSTIRDHATREVHQFAKSANRGQGGDQKVLFRYYEKQALNSYATALRSNIGDPAQLWTLLDPEQASAKPIALDRVTWVGPCTGLLEKMNNEHGAYDEYYNEDRTGTVKKIVVREYNEVDYIKVYYEGHEGSGTGNASGGQEHVIDVPAGVFIQSVETWWDWELSGIQFNFSDGKSTGRLGNRTNMGRHHETASYPGHRLCGIRVYGVQGKKCAMSFAFLPRPDYYSALVPASSGAAGA